MAEETLRPEWTAPRAIFWTLGITIVIYVVLSIIAVLAPDREAITGSSAPLAILFEQITGLPSAPVAAMAAVAMINGILVQIIMASRVLYGMAREGIAPSWFGQVGEARKTPGRATFTVAATILALALFFRSFALRKRPAWRLSAYSRWSISHCVRSAAFWMTRLSGAGGGGACPARQSALRSPRSRSSPELQADTE